MARCSPLHLSASQSLLIDRQPRAGRRKTTYRPISHLIFGSLEVESIGYRYVLMRKSAMYNSGSKYNNYIVNLLYLVKKFHNHEESGSLIVLSDGHSVRMSRWLCRKHIG